MHASKINFPHYFHFYASSSEYNQFIEAMKDAGYNKITRNKSLYLDNEAVLIQIRRGSKDTSFAGMILPLRTRLALEGYRVREKRLRKLVGFFGFLSLITSLLFLTLMSIDPESIPYILLYSFFGSIFTLFSIVLISIRMRNKAKQLEGDSIRVEVLATIETIKIISKIIYTVSKKITSTIPNESEKLQNYIPKEILLELEIALKDSGVISSLDTPVYRVKLPKHLKSMV